MSASEQQKAIREMTREEHAEQKTAFLVEQLLGLRAQLAGMMRTVTELLEVVNAAPPEEEERERPRTFGRRD